MKQFWLSLLACATASVLLGQEPKPAPSFPSHWSPWQWLARVEGDYQCNSSRKPQWWVKTIQPIWISPQTFHNTAFFQFGSMFDSDRSTLSPGLGYRYLVSPKSCILGLNSFYDVRYPHPLRRVSVGTDVQTQWVTLSGNYYRRVTDDWETIHVRNGVTTSEKTLNGVDVDLTAPFPYLPWFRVGAEYYHWGSIDRKMINGYKLYGQWTLAEPLTVEAGMSRDGLEHNNYLLISLNLGLPNYRQFTLWRDLVTKSPFPGRDLKRFVLTPVVRESRVINESRQTGSSGIVIGRGN